VEVFSGRPSDAPRSFAVGQTLTLKDGKNTLILTVTDRAGERQQEARTVFSDRPAVVASAPAPAPAPVPPVAAAPPVPKPASPPPAPTPEPAAKPAPPPQVAALPPPPPLVVRLSSPADKAKVEHETIALAGVASGGKGVSRVTVTLNGVEVHKRDEPSPARAVPLNLPIKLREGPNTLVVTVADADGALEQETRVVSYERPVPFGIRSASRRIARASPRRRASSRRSRSRAAASRTPASFSTAPRSTSRRSARRNARCS
jgi:hypothetical protein